MAKRDYGCEIMALVVLTALSGLSHFWYIIIAISIVTALAGVGFMLSRIFILVKREMLARLLGPACRKNTRRKAKVSVEIAQGPRSSLPVA